MQFGHDGLRAHWRPIDRGNLVAVALGLAVSGVGAILLQGLGGSLIGGAAGYALYSTLCAKHPPFCKLHLDYRRVHIHGRRTTTHALETVRPRHLFGLGLDAASRRWLWGRVEAARVAAAREEEGAAPLDLDALIAIEHLVEPDP